LRFKRLTLRFAPAQSHPRCSFPRPRNHRAAQETLQTGILSTRVTDLTLLQHRATSTNIPILLFNRLTSSEDSHHLRFVDAGAIAILTASIRCAALPLSIILDLPFASRRHNGYSQLHILALAEEKRGRSLDGTSAGLLAGFSDREDGLRLLCALAAWSAGRNSSTEDVRWVCSFANAILPPGCTLTFG
jgi:hypothetical protein